MKDILFYIISTIAGIIFYIIGSFLFGARNEGGKRTILAILGITSAVLGSVMAIYFIKNFDKTIDSLAIILGFLFFGYGVYLFFAALFASKNRIRKLFDILLGSWVP